MLIEKNQQIRPILQSKNGLHLSCYMSRIQSPLSYEKQLIESLEIARSHLSLASTKSEIDQFLSPLEQMKNDPSLLSHFKDNVALFRTTHSFRALSLPIEVEPLTVVATSFHIKPLIKWLQNDHQFLLLGFESHRASLYWGNHEQSEFLDSLFLTSQVRNSKALTEWMKSWVQLYAHRAKKLFVFFAGDKRLSQVVAQALRSPYITKKILKTHFNPYLEYECLREVRHQLRLETKLTLERTLVEFYAAEEKNQAERNLSKIAKAALQGHVKKLIVSDNMRIFGKMNSQTGALLIHPADLDHEDDDLLDDLAQEVLRQGGDVVVAPIEKMPKQRPALAILNDSSSAPLHRAVLTA